MKTLPRPNRSRAFTLADLLALLAVGTVVGAMVIPTLSNARARSGAVACASNQRQLAIATSLYSTANADALPPTDGWRNGTGSIVNLIGGGYWASVSPDIGSGTSIPVAMGRVRTALTNSPLWTYAADEALHQCPSDARFKLTPGRGWTFGSYSKVNGIAGLASWSPSQRPFERTGEIAEPSRTLLFVEESDPRGQNLGTWILNTSPTGWVDPLAAWHDAGANLVHVDGHLEYRRWVDPATLAAARGGDDGVMYFNWPGGNSSNPDFRRMWEGYRYRNWKPLAP